LICGALDEDDRANVDRRPKEDVMDQDVMESVPPLDCTGRRPSPATLASFHERRTPRNKGLRYPPDPPTVEEIVAVMHAAGDSPDGLRLGGVIVVLWRAGLRISEALALAETDLDPERGSLLVRHGKGGKRREVGMDRWGWTQLKPWLELRAGLPIGPLFGILRGPSRGLPRRHERRRRCGLGGRDFDRLFSSAAYRKIVPVLISHWRRHPVPCTIAVICDDLTRRLARD
jgi:integrase